MLLAPKCSSEMRRSDEIRPLLVHHVAQLLGLSPRTVRHHAFKGSLLGFKLQGTPKIWRFWRLEVERFVVRRRVP